MHWQKEQRGADVGQTIFPLHLQNADGQFGWKGPFSHRVADVSSKRMQSSITIPGVTVTCTEIN